MNAITLQDDLRKNLAMFTNNKYQIVHVRLMQIAASNELLADSQGSQKLVNTVCIRQHNRIDRAICMKLTDRITVDIDVIQSV